MLCTGLVMGYGLFTNGSSDIESRDSSPTHAFCLIRLALNKENYIKKAFKKLGTFITLRISFGCVPWNWVSSANNYPLVMGFLIIGST